MTKAISAVLLFAALGLAPGSRAASTAPADPAPGQVDVDFVAPAQFTDGSGRYPGPRREARLRELVDDWLERELPLRHP